MKNFLGQEGVTIRPQAAPAHSSHHSAHAAHTRLCPSSPFPRVSKILVSFTDLPKMQTLTPLKSHKREVFGDFTNEF
jgi:hypothetical protein